MEILRRIGAAALRRGHLLTEGLAEALGEAGRVLRFSRGLLEFKARPDDIFIVTYPRSGTTLMQHLLVLLAGRSVEELQHISQAAPWFERSLATGALTAEDLERLPSPRVFKSHLAFAWLPRGGRVIYVTRDGRDVAISYYHFYRSHLRYEGSFAEFFQRFLAGDLQYASWFKHTLGWERHREDPRLLMLSYEELVADLRGALERVARFCGLPLSEARAEEIAARCSFAAMKRQEHKFDFTTELLLQRGYRPGSFLRKGRVGEGKLELNAEQQEAFLDRRRRPPRRPDVELRLPLFLR